MKLIIDIPDEMYDWAINYNKFYQTYSKNDLLEVIQNGKPVIVEADMEDKELDFLPHKKIPVNLTITKISEHEMKGGAENDD